MKNLIILLLFVFMSSIVMANEAPDTVTTDFKHVVYKDVKDVIKNIADALKVGTEHVYEILVKQQLVNSFVYIIILIIGVILTGISYKEAMKVTFDHNGDIIGGGIPPLIYSIVLGLVGLISTLSGICNIREIITGFVNPEYLAITKIIELIKQ